MGWLPTGVSNQILIVGEARNDTRDVAVALRAEGLEATISPTFGEARSALLRMPIVMILFGRHYPDGFPTSLIGGAPAETRVIVVGGEVKDLSGAEFRAGADQHLDGPVSAAEIVSRVRAIMRRASSRAVGEPLIVGDFELDFVNLRARVGGAVANLNATEFRMLAFFMSHPGRLISRGDLIAGVWGGRQIAARTVDYFIKRLRDGVVRAGGRDPLSTVRGLGYRFDLPSDAT